MLMNSTIAIRPRAKVRPALGRKWLQLMINWAERRGQRRALAQLDIRLLDDIGLTPRDAEQESAKPFWR